MNMTVTQIDTGSIALDDSTFKHGEVLTVGAGTTVKGTIFAWNTSTSKWGPFATAGINGLNVPSAVICEDLVSTGGDEIADLLIAGEVKFERLIIQADGDNSNLTPVWELAMRQNSIIPVRVNQLSP